NTTSLHPFSNRFSSNTLTITHDLAERVIVTHLPGLVNSFTVKQFEEFDAMNLTDQLTDYVNAAFTGLWLLTQEPDEAEREITQLARNKSWKLASWDVAQGLRFPNAPHNTVTEVGAGDPLAVLRAVPTLADRNGTSLVLLHNFHKFLGNPEVVQTAFAQLIAGKQQRTFLVVLSAVVQIPVELEKLFVVLEHALPDRDQLERIARELTSDQPEDLPQGEELR